MFLYLICVPTSMNWVQSSFDLQFSQTAAADVGYETMFLKVWLIKGSGENAEK